MLDPEFSLQPSMSGAPLEESPKRQRFFKFSRPSKRLVFFLLAFFIFILISSLIAGFFYLQTEDQPSQKYIKPTTTPTIIILPDGPLATDSALLEIESQLNDLEGQLRKADLRLEQLLPPKLHLNLKIDDYQSKDE